MTDDELRLSGAYALDAVDDAERAEHDRLMARDDNVRAETSEFGETAAALSHLASTTPPESLRRDVLAAIRTVRPLPPAAPAETEPIIAKSPGVEPTDAQPTDARLADPERAGDESSRPAPHDRASSDAAPSDAGPSDAGDGSAADRLAAPSSAEDSSPRTVVSLAPRRRRAWTVIAAAAAAIIGVLVWVGVRDGSEPVAPTAVEQVIEAPDATTYTAQVGDATATLIVSESEGKAVVRTENMPNAPAGRDFQLWYIDGERASSAAIMPYSEDGSNELVLSADFRSADRVAITEEPEGGSDRPTSPAIVAFDLQ